MVPRNYLYVITSRVYEMTKVTFLQFCMMASIKNFEEEKRAYLETNSRLNVSLVLQGDV